MKFKITKVFYGLFCWLLTMNANATSPTAVSPTRLLNGAGPLPGVLPITSPAASPVSPTAQSPVSPSAISLVSQDADHYEVWKAACAALDKHVPSSRPGTAGSASSTHAVKGDDPRACFISEKTPLRWTCFKVFPKEYEAEPEGEFAIMALEVLTSKLQEACAEANGQFKCDESQSDKSKTFKIQYLCERNSTEQSGESLAEQQARAPSVRRGKFGCPVTVVRASDTPAPRTSSTSTAQQAPLAPSAGPWADCHL